MAYAQKNYGEKQGINGKYTIAQIGCFITAFCNLLERFGSGVAPNHLNNVFRDRGIYIDVDDGIRDDVGWGTITAYDGSVTVTGTGAGAPPHSNAIVKFNYRSPNSGQFTTHFCLVNDVKAGTIIDSWDGVVKHWSVYGNPIAWATYQKTNAQPVRPIEQGDIPMNDGDVVNIYRALLERDPDPSGMNHYRGTSWKSTFYDILNSKERQQMLANKQGYLNALQQALENEKNKPPQTVVKEVEKIVEKIVEVEKPVEVIKEVPAQVDEKQVVTNFFKRIWESLFKKG